MSNIIGELMQAGIVCEPAQARAESASPGRRPAYLDLADASPCEVGVFISRHDVQVAVGDLRTHVFWSRSASYPERMDERVLVDMTLALIREALANCRRPVLGIGIATIGPVSTQRGTLLRPANFYGIHDVPIVRIVAEETGYPVFFTADSMAGAQGEKLFGEGRAHDNFLFLLLWEGIGCGVVIDGKLHAGEHGLGGELGHTSIRFDGPVCSCGSRGCLELYASTARMAEHVRAAWRRGTFALKGAQLNGHHPQRRRRGRQAARSAVEEYCDYLSCALVNMVNVFDPEIIYICQYENPKAGELLAGFYRSASRACSLRIAAACPCAVPRSVPAR